MPSASSPVKDALESYVAGRVKAERLVIAVSAAYYGDARNGQRESLQPLIDVIDRASPGIVELGIAAGGPGFDIRLAERPFPKEHEGELRRGAGAGLGRGGGGGGGWGRGRAKPGLCGGAVGAGRPLVHPADPPARPPRAPETSPWAF